MTSYSCLQTNSGAKSIKKNLDRFQSENTSEIGNSGADTEQLVQKIFLKFNLVAVIFKF